jgi:hypothetical protein
VSGALRRFLERAAELHLSRFESCFPGGFDWEALCADVPAVAEQTGRPLPEQPGEEPSAVLEDTARGVFRGVWLATLGLLTLLTEGDDDPESLLEHVAGTPPEEDEETAYQALLAEPLEDVEALLLGDRVDGPSEVAERAAALADRVWPTLEALLVEDEDGPLAEGARSADLLWGVARVAAILAVYRWMAAEQAAPRWPRLEAG